MRESTSTAPQILIDDDSHSSGGGGQIYFGNSSHGVGRNTGITNFTSGNDVVLHTSGDGGAGIKTDSGFLKVASNGNVGIGTKVPSQLLHIFNTSDLQQAQRMTFSVIFNPMPSHLVRRETQTMSCFVMNFLGVVRCEEVGGKS